MTAPSWQESVVAIALIAAVVLLMAAAILRYNAEEALRIWAGLGPIAGVVTGHIATRFFRIV